MNQEIKMVSVQNGTFQFRDKVSVTVSDFEISAYPVTQAQWRMVMGTSPSYFKGDDLPVENVSWFEIKKFIEKLNQKSGLQYRLPKEIEWEYAARGGNLSKGFLYSGSNNLDEVGWYNSCATKTHKVGGKAPNELGLYDMSGNVWEWCEDWYKDEDQYENESTCVIRGGGWISDPEGCRVAYRGGNIPVARSISLGFRLAI